MRKQSPSMSALSSFECAARYESFTLAAEELGVTQSAVNRQVRELERFLGTTLFRRVGRSIRLTVAGQRLSADLARDLANLDRSIERALISGPQASHLNIGVPPTFGARWLVPRLSDFLERNPGVSVSIRSYTTIFDMQSERVDLAIMFGSDEWPGARLRAMGPENVLAVASPGLIAERSLASVSDFTECPRLVLESRPAQWQDYFAANSLSEAATKSGLMFDQFSMIITACLSGLGVGLVPSYLIENELKDGSLVALDKLPSQPDLQYRIAIPTGPALKPVMALAAWLSQQAKNSAL